MNRRSLLLGSIAGAFAAVLAKLGVRSRDHWAEGALYPQSTREMSAILKTFQQRRPSAEDVQNLVNMTGPGILEYPFDVEWLDMEWHGKPFPKCSYRIRLKPSYRMERV